MKWIFGLALAALTAGLAPTVTAAQAVEITFYHYQSEGNDKALRGILDDFEARNPGVTVKDIFSQSTQITSTVQAALAAGRPVDIATVIGKNVRYFIHNTPAVPLNADPAKAGFLEAYLPNFLDIGRDGDKVYAVPHAYGLPVMFYNKTLFRAAGLDPDKPPRTWDETVEAAKAIKARTSAWGLAHLLASNKDYGTMLMVMNAGGKYLSPQGNCAEFDSPQGIAALQLWQDLVNKDGVTPVANDRQFESAFTSGQLGMFLYSSAALQPFVKAAKGHFDIGVAPYPSFGDAPRRLPNSGAALMLYSPAGPRRDAALKLLAYLSERTVSNLWSRESGYMPVAKDPLADPAMARYVSDFPYVKPVIDEMSSAVPTATWGQTGALEAQTIVSNLIDQLWADDGPAARLVPDAVKRMNEVMQCPAAQ